MSFLFDVLRYVGVFEILNFVVINHGLNNARNWGLTAGRVMVLLLLDSNQSVSGACLLFIDTGSNCGYSMKLTTDLHLEHESRETIYTAG
jgi:hypothetical protein